MARPGTGPGRARGRGRVAVVVGAGLLVAGLVAAAPAELPRFGPARNFALTTQLGDRLWLAQLRGRVVALFFTCTTCTGCPALLPGVSAAAHALGDAAGRRVVFVAVTVDPGRDTPAVLRGFARERGLTPGVWVLLTGEAAEVEAVGRWYGADVRRERGRLGHACQVTLVDREGEIRIRRDPEPRERLVGDIRTLLSDPRPH